MARTTTGSATAFPPHVLREYALLADGERGVVVGPRGDFAWMCAPRWHSDPVFASLVGGPGVYAVTPSGTRFVWGGFYDEGTLIWNSRWVTTRGAVECREALALPADAHTAVLLRRVRAVEGPASVDVVLDVRAGFGRHRASEVRRDGGTWTARSGGLRLRWSGAAGARHARDGCWRLRLDLEPGAHHDLVLELADRPLDGAAPEPAVAWEATETAWAGVVPPMGALLAPRDARQAFAVLHGLTSRGGGMVAAATLGLPERADQGRAYDYRYTWLRDQCYAGEALATLGPTPLLADTTAFVAERVLEDGPHLAPAYQVDGRPVPEERALPDVEGYPGGEVRVGNRVRRQFQLDVLGEALLLFAAAARHDQLGSAHRRAVEAAVAAVEKRWRDPDAGVWELDDRRWAHSRLMCVAGLRAAGGLATPSQGAEWSALADAILADVGRDCVHPSGRWQRSPDDARVDAALLLPPLRGALPPDDPRSVSTLAAVTHELGRDGYVYRFRHDDRPLHEAEGAFLLCGFLMALATHQCGHHVEAVAWFERGRAACGPPALFTEELDVAQHQLRGNLPQAFVHALLLECCSTLADLRPGRLHTAGIP